MCGRLGGNRRGVLERISDNPWRAAGAIAALVATAVIIQGAVSAAGTSVTNVQGARIALSAAVTVSLERPAYPVAVVVGLAVLLRQS